MTVPSGQPVQPEKAESRRRWIYLIGITVVVLIAVVVVVMLIGGGTGGHTPPVSHG